MRREKNNEVWGRMCVALILIVLLLPFLDLSRPIRHFVRAQIASKAPLLQTWTTCWGEARSRTEHGFTAHETLQKWMSRLKFYGFHSTTSDMVRRGHGGWLYFTQTEERRCIHHTYPFTQDELADWGGAFENWRALLAERGAEFFVVIAPDKHTIYTDSVLSEGPNPVASRMDQLYDYLRAHTAVRIVDIRPGLLAEKDSRQLYFKTDTHWNSLGAFVAFQGLAHSLRALYPQIPNMTFSDYVEEWAQPNGMELGRFAGVDDVLKESTVYLRPKVEPKIQYKKAIAKNMHNSSIITPKIMSHNTAGVIPKMLVLRDSFTTALVPFVATTAKEATFIWWWQLEWNDVEAAQPDVVLFELVERDLHSPRIKPKPLLKQLE